MESDKKLTKGFIRVSVGFPAEHYAGLERLAKHKRVSIAWVVREAVEHYLERDVPLFQAKGIKIS